MTKNQEQINNEILSTFEKTTDVNIDEDIKKALAKAKLYNVEIGILTQDGKSTLQKPENIKRILNLEFGGQFVTKKVSLKDDAGTIQLTYFRPFLAGDDTMKIFPAFWRLAAVTLILGLAVSWILALITAASIRRDIKKIHGITSNLIKGSSINSGKPATYTDTQVVLEELDSIKNIFLKKEQLKKRMTADFAHELRTPLTTLQSHLEALIDGVWQPTIERFVSCHEEILRLIRLVGDLERLFKFEDENMILEKTNFDLTELAKSISLNFEGELSHKNIAFKFTGNHHEIRADKDKISQVLVNLLSNSLKYTPVNGRILMDVTGDKEHVYLVINDSGVGIPTKDLSNVFNRFYRSDASRTRETGGAGIGLTIAKSIVEAHRGSIDVVSQENLGTEITVILPRR
jgi:signal transduction histidine kinase